MGTPKAFFTLRITNVYAYEDGCWQLAHNHATPANPCICQNANDRFRQISLKNSTAEAFDGGVRLTLTSLSVGLNHWPLETSQWRESRTNATAFRQP